MVALSASPAALAASPAKKPVYLSASRIETFQTCSALYAAKYLAKIPDPVGDAARRGSVAHDTLEILLNPRHDRVYKAALADGTCLNHPALARVIQRITTRYEVNDPDDLVMIDGFIMTALRHDFKGVKGTYKALPEKAFEINVDQADGRRYSIKGFIDQLFFVKDDTGTWLDIKDFKTGAMFKRDKLDYPVQALMYLLAARHLFPEFDRRRFRFQFVKGKNQYVQCDATEDQLNGFEWVLSDIQRSVDAFTMANAMDNPKAAAGKGCWLYGKECGAKHPLRYYAIVDPAKGVVSTAFTAAELKPKAGQTVEPRSWAGCPYYYGDSAPASAPAGPSRRGLS